LSTAALQQQIDHGCWERQVAQERVAKIQADMLDE
jgi:hypothetical protein